MTGFTKGPWVVEMRGTKSEVERGSHHYVVMKASDKRDIDAVALVRTFPYMDMQRDQEANAHLISAAPDMYEALDLMFAEFGSIIGLQGPQRTARDKAAAALRKARNEHKG